jgi:hypothetical protein
MEFDATKIADNLYIAMHLGRGVELDALGARSDINLKRNQLEPDQAFRERIIAKVQSLRGETTASAEDTKANHVRDAVRANQ